MRLEKDPGILLMAIAFAGLGSLTDFAASPRQTTGTGASDPLSGYIGTWIATNPGETSPFLVLKLSEAEGALTGTMSHFTAGAAHDGGITWRPLSYAADRLSYFKVGDSALSFKWIGDRPFDAEDVKFVAEGTDIAYVLLPISREEMERFVVDNRLSRFDPI